MASPVIPCTQNKVFFSYTFWDVAYQVGERQRYWIAKDCACGEYFKRKNTGVIFVCVARGASSSYGNRLDR